MANIQPFLWKETKIQPNWQHKRLDSYKKEESFGITHLLPTHREADERRCPKTASQFNKTRYNLFNSLENRSAIGFLWLTFPFKIISPLGKLLWFWIRIYFDLRFVVIIYQLGGGLFKLKSEDGFGDVILGVKVEMFGRRLIVN